MPAVPIWKDHFTNLGAVSSSYFRIRLFGETIYQGKAVRAASSGNLYVRVNDICAAAMSNVPPSVPLSIPSQITFPMSFVVQKSSDGNSWTNAETIQFNDDWSYDPSFDPSIYGYAFPITGRVDLRQTVYATMNAPGTVSISVNYGGTVHAIGKAPSTSSDGSAFQNALIHAGQAYLSFPLPSYDTYSGKTLTSFRLSTHVYVVSKQCARYVVYYKNPFGGYDHLLIEGVAKRRRAVSRETFIADYDNNYNGREGWNYQNENTETWELHSGLLTDDESARMPYLIESPDVYFCDLVDASTIIPAVIDTNSYDVKSYRSNGRTFFDCAFELSIAQKQYRR